MEEEEGRFRKHGLAEASPSAGGQLRLLVHCPGCPHFICVVAGTKTVGELQKDIVIQHRQLFGAAGDIPAVKIRWLEDSQHHALAADSLCNAVLTDREKIFACTGLNREGIFDQPSHAGTAGELVSHWRNTCIDTAARLSALSQQDGREQEVFEAGGLQVLLSIAIHSGNLMPGDVAIQDIHAGLRSLLSHEDAAGRIMASACEGQVVALLQVPDPDLAGLAAFMCARLATNPDSHVALKSWGAPARLAKAVQLSGNSAVRFDAMTTLRLMADNTDCHPALLSSPVVKVIIHAASDKSDSSLRLKALRTIAAIAAAGSAPTRECLKSAHVMDTLRVGASANENDVRRAAAVAIEALAGGAYADICLPGLDPTTGGLSDLRPAKTPQPYAPTHTNSRHAYGSLASALTSQPNATTDDFSTIAQEAYEMTSSGRGYEYIESGGIAKLSSIALSSAPLATPPNPDWDTGPPLATPPNPDWDTGPPLAAPPNPDWDTGPPLAAPPNPDWDTGSKGASAAANLLWSLCKSDLGTRQRIVEAGGVNLVQTLVKSSDETVQVPGASSLALLCNSRTLHAQLLELGVLQTLFVLVMSKHEATRVQAAKALSHLAHESEARAKMLSHQPLVKILSSQPANASDDAFWAYLSLLPRK